MNKPPIAPEVIAEHNAAAAPSHAHRFDALQAALTGRKVRLDRIVKAVSQFEVVLLPRAGVAGLARAGRPVPGGVPRDLETRLAEAAVVRDLTGLAVKLALPFPDDEFQDSEEAASLLRRWDLSVGLVHASPATDSGGAGGSSAFSHVDTGVRRAAIEQTLEGIRTGRAWGAQDLVVEIEEHSGEPGQTHARRALDHLIDSLENIYSVLPRDWRLLLPVSSSACAAAGALWLDWGTVWMVAQELGPRALGLLDLGASPSIHALQQVIARLIAVNRLGAVQIGSGAAQGVPSAQQLLLTFHELADAAADAQVQAFRPRFEPFCLVDDLAPGRDPIEVAIRGGLDLQRAFTQALLIDREALTACQTARDLTLAEEILRTAFETDVSPILAEARQRRGAALDPLNVYRKTLCPAAAAKTRKARPNEQD